MRTIGFLLLACPIYGQERMQPPQPQAAAKSRQSIAEIFAAEIERAKTPVARKELAAKMLALANDTKEDAPNRWILYAQAREMAASAGDVALTHDAIRDTDKAFVFEATSEAAQLAERLAKSAAPAKGLMDFAAARAEEAIAADEYRSAARLFAVGVNAAKSVKDKGNEKEMAKRLESRTRYASELAKAFEEAKGDDVAMGRFQAFRKENWAKGLPLLANAKDEGISAVARKDAGNPTEAKEQIVLGDAWSELATKAKGDEKLGMLRRALRWYRQSVGDLGGLAKTKVEGKIASVAEDFDKEAGLKRHRWLWEKGGYKLVGFGVWDEKCSDGMVLKWTESDRTKDYVEIRGVNRGGTFCIRIMSNTTLYRINSESDFRVFYHGKWID